MEGVAVRVVAPYNLNGYTPAHRDRADDEGKAIAVALLADFNVDGDPLGEAQQSDYFQASSCGSPSFGGVESGSASVILNRSLAAPRKSRTVGALDLSSNSSSSGVTSLISAGASSLTVILFLFTFSRGVAENER